MELSQRGYFAKGDQKMTGDGYDFLNNVAIDHNLFALQVLKGEISDDRNIEDGACAVAF